MAGRCPGKVDTLDSEASIDAGRRGASAGNRRRGSGAGAMESTGPPSEIAFPPRRLLSGSGYPRFDVCYDLGALRNARRRSPTKTALASMGKIAGEPGVGR